MRYLRQQVLNRRTPHDQRLTVDMSHGVIMNTPNNLLLPKGTTEERPVSPLNGMIRYNITTSELEVYQVNNWRALRFKESTHITQQNLGAGDSDNVFFGPLNPAPPTTVQSGTTWGGQNLLVIVENVIQLSNINYTIVQNPSVPTESYTGSLSAEATDGVDTLYFNSSVNCSGATGDGNTTTITFDSHSQTPFAIGSTITVTNFIPVSFNGVYTVSASATNSVSFLNGASGVASFYGTVTSNNTIYTSIDLVGAVVTGNPSIQPNTVVVSYESDPQTDALIKIVLNKPLVTASINANAVITLTAVTYTGSGYFLKFSSPVPVGKTVTVLHGFDQ